MYKIEHMLDFIMMAEHQTADDAVVYDPRAIKGAHMSLPNGLSYVAWPACRKQGPHLQALRPVFDSYDIYVCTPAEAWRQYGDAQCTFCHQRLHQHEAPLHD